MLSDRRRAEMDAVEDAVRRAYAEAAAAGRPRPTGDELHAAAGGLRGANHLNAIARALRRAGAVPDLPPAWRVAAARRAERAAAAVLAAGRRASAAVEDLPPGRRWAREHFEREHRLGIGRASASRRGTHADPGTPPR
jgi:hypothetical protein